MIDYYEELSLNKDLDTKRIQEELVRLESLWRKREVNSPEKANRMLGFIMDAQKVFASDASRRKYDSSIENSKKEPEDPETLRSKSLEKWTDQAVMFFRDGQYDLAKAAIDRALSYAGGESDDGDLFRLASNIYLENNDMTLSLECINKAIITSPDQAVYYIDKAQIYERMARSEQQYDKMQNVINECRNNLMHAVSKAESNGDATVQGVALGMLAFSLYFHSNPDAELAEEYAHRAETLGECANSKRVLDDIIEKKNTPIYNEAKKEESFDNLQHLRRAAELYESLGCWRDASERVTMCRTRIDQLEEEEARRQQEKEKLREKLEKLREERARRRQAEAEERERQAQRQAQAELEARKREVEERERQTQAKLEAQKKKKEQIIKFVKADAPIVAAVAVVMILICYDAINWEKYDAAVDLMNEGKYEEAMNSFNNLGDFSDSRTKMDECEINIKQQSYDKAMELMDKGKYEEAMAAFNNLGDFSDSRIKIEKCEINIKQQSYDKAMELMDKGKSEK